MDLRPHRRRDRSRSPGAVSIPIRVEAPPDNNYLYNNHPGGFGGGGSYGFNSGVGDFFGPSPPAPSHIPYADVSVPRSPGADSELSTNPSFFEQNDANTSEKDFAVRGKLGEISVDTLFDCPVLQ